MGLIVITDSIKRLEGLVRDDPGSNPENDEWEQLAQKLQVSVAILRSGKEPIAMQMAKQVECPILLLSTQRYFMLDAETRERLFHFVHDETTWERNLVLFDEKPTFCENVTITDETLCDIEKTLRMKLSDDFEEKDFVTRGYEDFKKYLQTVMTDRERIEETKDIYLFWKDDMRNSLTTNDEQFFKVIEEYGPQLRQKYFDIMKDLRSLQEVARNGAILTSHKKRKANSEYELSLHLIRDNRDCFFLGKGRKFFVFDGTADIDPSYSVDYVEMAGIEKCKSPIALKIISVNTNTSKGNLMQMNLRGNKKTDFTDAVKECIKRRTRENEDVLIVTFKDDVCFYEENYSVGYFGNIKGFNDFRDYTNLAHVGLNRFPDTEYLFLYYGTHPEEYKELSEMGEKKSMKTLNEAMSYRKDTSELREAINEIAVKCILADLEQNIFRVKIRDITNTTPVTVLIFYEFRNEKSIFPRLKEMIEERYKPYGIQFEYEDCLEELSIKKTKSRKNPNGKKNYTQRLLEWLETRKPDTVFTAAEMRKGTGLTADQIKQARRNQDIKRLLNMYKMDNRGTYKVCINCT